MFMISFMFRPGEYDDEFRRLDAEIQRIARRFPGYAGQETWLSEDGRTHNAVYYWDSLQRLREFSDAASHRTAKAEYRRWYEGYQVVVSEIKATYGDGRLPHLTTRPER